MKTTTSTPAVGHRASSMKIPGMPQIMFAPEDGTGTPDAAAVAAAEAAAAKAAEDTAAEEARAAKELEDAEAAAALAADSGKDAAALAAEKRDLLREVMDKKTKLKDATAAAAAASAKLKEYEGIDVAKYRELVQKEKDAETAAAEARGDFERVKTMMAEEHAKGVKTLQEQIDDLTKQLGTRDTTINDLTVGNDFGSSSFIKDSLTLTPNKARQLYGAHFEVENGQTVAYDKPAGKANRTKFVDASGNALSFDEAFKRIVDADPDKESLLKAKVKEGSNSNSNQSKTPPKPVTTGLSGVDRIRASFEKQG
ncbi:DUF6651 domain-containing protein [Agrobacterium sp. CG674]